VLGLAHPVAFLPSTDPVRSERFFVDVLGLTVLSRSDFAYVLDLDGATLRITKVDELHPQPFTVLGWVVADVRAQLSQLQANGVTALRYPGMDQDDDGVWTAPSGEGIAWFHDPDGNVLSLTQPSVG
jgi:catechol 2,3-dioxygenase-like lactoylglutathione lyase family enzyme